MTLKRPSGTDEVTGIAGPTLECFQPPFTPGSDERAKTLVSEDNDIPLQVYHYNQLIEFPAVKVLSFFEGLQMSLISVLIQLGKLCSNYGRV